MLGEPFIVAFFEPFIKRITLAVRRHVFPSLGITVIITLFVVFLLLNPWFGSQKAKYVVIQYMLGGADDIEYIMKKSAVDSNTGPAFVAGAARAGFFTSSDKAIVERWSEEFSGSDYTNQRGLGKKFAAILAAREKAELHQPPFQFVGIHSIASSPSCQQTRPPTGQVYVRSSSYLAAQLHSGDALKISRQDGLGRPVVAVVNKVPDMPENTDLYLNRSQMIDFLAATAPLIAVNAVITNDPPNQNDEDRHPSDVNISCRHG